MRQFARSTTLVVSLLAGVGCHPTTTIVTTSSAAVGGTIAGIVTGPAEGSLGDRTITLVNTDTGQRFQTTTGQNGGYSLRVPAGTYRLDVQLRGREKLAEESATILLKISGGDASGSVEIDTTRQ